jgi:ubiquinone/menaquinone biosynthesis C-methylase UbiE
MISAMNESRKSPTERFSDRVANYIKYRPSYPDDVLELLRNECGLSPQSVVADVGAGTGIFTRLLLNRSARVIAVEPNREMRNALVDTLSRHTQFSASNGRAEATGLLDESVDLITAAQAFHWFKPEETKREFQRILKPGGWVAIIRNERRTDSPFGKAYEELLVTGTSDYTAVDHKRITDKDLARFFAPAEFQSAWFSNFQEFDYESLKGRVMSSSYVPSEDDSRHVPLMSRLRELFDTYENDGKVRFDYRTLVRYGQLGST